MAKHKINPFKHEENVCSRCQCATTIGVNMRGSFVCGSCFTETDLNYLSGRLTTLVVDTTNETALMNKAKSDSVKAVDPTTIACSLLERAEDVEWLLKETCWHSDDTLCELIKLSPGNDSAASRLSTLIACYAASNGDRNKAHEMAAKARLAGKRLRLTIRKTEEASNGRADGQPEENLRTPKRASK